MAMKVRKHEKENIHNMPRINGKDLYQDSIYSLDHMFWNTFNVEHYTGIYSTGCYQTSGKSKGREAVQSLPETIPVKVQLL
jgi:hypothetical protein